MPYHTPIMVSEVLEGLQVTPGKRYIDATYGGGGHTKAIREAGGIVLGIDQDPDAGAVLGNFRDIERIAKENGFSEVDGVLFDLGVSSHQLDTPARGFSFRFGEAPLDLRMNQREGISAAEYLQHVSEKELYEILATYSEAESSRAIARSIVRARRIKPITTTGDLLQITGKRAAAQVFQALRIYVNDELGALKAGLSGARLLIKPGGRLVVLSFHSLEDRIVKQFMRGVDWKVITKKPIEPGEQELAENRRSRSAKLRIAEKI